MHKYNMDWGWLRRKGDNRTKPLPGQYVDLEKFWSTSIRWQFLPLWQPRKKMVSQGHRELYSQGEKQRLSSSMVGETRKILSAAFVCCNCYYTFPICNLISISKYYIVSVLRTNFLAYFKNSKFTENCFLKELTCLKTLFHLQSKGKT